MENQPNSTVMSVKDWLITYLICAIPIIGFVMLFVWAFGNDANETKANWAKASLLWMVIAFVLGILFFIVFGAAIAALVGSTGGY